MIDQLNHELETFFTAAIDKKMVERTSRLTTRLRLKTHLRFDPYSQVASLEIQETQLRNMRVKFSFALACMLGFDMLDHR